MQDEAENIERLSVELHKLRERVAQLEKEVVEHKLAERIMQARLRLLKFAVSHAMDELLTATLDEIEILTGSSIGFFHFLEPDQKMLSLQSWSTNTLKHMCAAATKGNHFDIAEAGVWVDCVRERSPVTHNDYYSLPHRKEMPQWHEPVFREIVCPVFRGDKIVAILGVGNKPIDYDETDSEIVSQIGDLAWDIVERKLMEQAVILREHEYRTLLDNLPDLIVRYDTQLRRTYLNPAWEKASGLSAEEVLQVFDLDIPKVCNPTAPEYQEKLLQVLSEGTPQTIDFNWENSQGELLSLEYLIVPEYDRYGKIASVLAVGRDITERKQMEKALRRSRDELELRVRDRTAELTKANEELKKVPSRLISVQEEERRRLAGELHDSIGQTLAALKFNIEFVLGLRDREDSEGAFKYLEHFVPTLQRSIDETRAIYTGLRPRMLEEMGLVATLKWFCREFMRLYPKHHVELDIQIEEDDIPEDLKIALFRISQEALNNIAKHSKAEWVDASLIKNGKAIELTISDDGVGMDLAYVHSHGATVRSLGLTSMRERAEFTGGTLSVESAEGEGTRIVALWPLEIGESHGKR